MALLTAMLAACTSHFGQVIEDSTSVTTIEDTPLLGIDKNIKNQDSIKDEIKNRVRKKIPKIRLHKDSILTRAKSRKRMLTSDRFKLDSLKSKSKKEDFIARVKECKYTPSLTPFLTPSLSGSIISESYATNYLDPYTRSESFYTRVYGSPSIELMDLPFNLNFYYTSEDNSYYNSNYISLDFDLNRYRQNLRSKAEEKINDQLEAKKKSISDLTDVSKAKQIIEKRIAQEKSKALNLQHDLKMPQFDTSILMNQGRIKQQELEKGLDSTISQKKDSLGGLANDSLISNALLRKEKVMDSLSQIQNRIEKYESQLSNLEQKYSKLKSIDKSIKDSIGLLQKQYRSQDFIEAKLKKTKLGSKFTKVISKVNKFNLGLTSPMLSEYTLNGIPVKGINLSWALPSHNFEIAVGKTFRSEYNTYGLEQPQAVFERNVVGFKSEQKFGKNKDKIISLTSVSFYDDKNVESPKQNFLHALDFESKISKRMYVTLSLNHSIYKQEELENVHVELLEGGTIAPDKFQGFKDHFAVEGGLEYQVSKNINLETSYKRISPEYVTLGNPFLRNNFHELDVKAKTKLFKRKITLSSFFKRYEDNITGLSKYTNHLSGYGITARSNFKKSLNFQFQHTPYQQGNNNPDSLFRTDNQLEVTSFNIIYNKIVKSNVLTSVLTFVNSTIDFNAGEQQVNNTMYLSSTNYSSKKLNLNATFSRNLTGPSIDTLNFWGVRLGLSQKNGKIVNYAISSFYDGFDSGAFRHRSTLQARFNILPKLETTLSGEYGQIKGLYGLNEKDIFGFRMILKYQL